jgi:hypothetical protein
VHDQFIAMFKKIVLIHRRYFRKSEITVDDKNTEISRPTFSKSPFNPAKATYFNETCFDYDLIIGPILVNSKSTIKAFIYLFI